MNASVISLAGRVERFDRVAWVPIPILVLGMLVLWAMNLQGAYFAPRLVFALQFVFMTFASALIIYLVSRSFLARGAPGLLLVNCGMVFWGLSGLVAGAVSRGDVNVSVTVHNMCVWLSALCHTAGVALHESRTSLSHTGCWLLIMFSFALAAVGLIVGAATAGWLPTFFVQGQGGTQVRQIVLGSAVLMFVLSALVLGTRTRSVPSSFTRWYGNGLLLMAAGLFGVLIQSVHSSVLGWMGVATQWLSGPYLVVAAGAAARESRAWDISLAATPRDVRLRYCLAALFVVTAAIVHLVVVPASGSRVVYVTFFPAVLLAALYGGRGPGILAAVLSAAMIDLYWVEPIGRFSMGDVTDKVGVAFFLGSSIAVAWTIAAMQRAQARALAAEGALALTAERQRAGEALRRSEEKFSTMFEKAPLPAVLARLPDGIIADVNDACLALFGVSRRDVVGRTAVVLGLASDDDALARFLGDVVARGSLHGMETAARGRAGQPLRIANDLTLIEVDGRMHVLAMMMDITARKQAEEALSNHAAHLERLVEQRTAKLNELVGDLEAFSYSIVHDMRAPLRAMQGFAQVLADECGPLSPTADDCVRRITTAAGRMDRLIQDGFNYGRLMREDLPLSPIAPAVLLGGMIETYPSFQPPHADVLLDARFPRVMANEAGLTQCMSNLLGNAVKFVVPGVVPRVRVWAESVDGRVRLLVRDNGIGMDKDAHRTLFRIFQRLGTGYEGTGVGLAIVKKAAERMGGRVGFESELGQGSTFWVDLAPADDAGGVLDAGRPLTRFSDDARSRGGTI